ncbi:MAG TPA: sulfatase [Planctomycetaceae bacterium]|nr:sulfatase [Blastopirellula sp.]HAY79291.1 sulfatase [Planctomycetaceae bacterium]
MDRVPYFYDKRVRMTKHLWFCFILACAPLCTVTARADDKPWNIIVILVDDLGWMDLTCQGSEFYRTPHIDRLAATGMRFTDGYAACAVCSPTRAAMMTGRYPARLGITDWIRAEFQLRNRQGPSSHVEGYHDGGRALLTPVNQSFLPHKELTIAELARQHQYKTCFIGKWHLGGKGYLPTDQGFDFNHGGWDYGQTPSYFDPYTNKRLQVGIPTLKPRQQGEYLTDREADIAVQFIADHKDQPFLLYLSHYAVHTPIQAKQDVTAKYQADKDGQGQDNAAYAAMVESVDDAMGRIESTLAKHDLTDNTVVIFTGDNGGLDNNNNPTDNAPLRIGKGYAFEGGIRVPWIIRWPGVTQPASVSTQPICSIDLFPTVAQLLGAKLPNDLAIDGIDLRPALEGKPLGNRSLFWHFPHYRHRRGRDPYSIIRQGKFKLIKFYDPPKLELYNLEDDLSEKTDLLAKMPAKAKALELQLATHLSDIKARLPIPKDKP